MYYIKENVEARIEIKGSKFICCLMRIDDPNNLKDYLSLIKAKYPQATHYCYGMICDTTTRSNDDGEPASTAGIPILESLKNKQLNHCLAIVVRYFGGTLLGASGLVHAYKDVTLKAIEQATLLTPTKATIYQIEFDYPYISKIEYILNETKILEKDYNEKVSIKFVSINDLSEKLISCTSGKINIKKLDEIIVEL